MADNVPITAGSGTNIATDDVAGVHYQRVKVDLGAADATSPLVRGQQTKANSIGVTLASDESTVPVNIVAVSASATGSGVYKSLSLVATGQQVKASAGTVYGYHAVNRSTSPVYVKFYNHASPTIGTTVPVYTMEIPANASDHIAGIFTFPGPGVAFSTAISIAATTGFADNSTGAPAANDVIIDVFYD